MPKRKTTTVKKVYVTRKPAYRKRRSGKAAYYGKIKKMVKAIYRGNAGWADSYVTRKCQSLARLTLKFQRACVNAVNRGQNIVGVSPQGLAMRITNG